MLILKNWSGTTVVIPVQDEFYGDRLEHVKDPFGYTRMIGTPQNDMNFEIMQRLADKMVAGKQFRITGKDKINKNYAILTTPCN